MFDYPLRFDATSPNAASHALDPIPPGPELAAAIAAIDVEALSASERVDLLVAHRRLAAHYEAKASADIVAVEDYFLEEGDNEQEAFSATAAEIRAALRLTRSAADGEVWFADAMWRRLPRVGMALVRGDICARRARVFIHGTEHLPKHTARSVVRDLVAGAGELTTGQLRAQVRKRCFEADPNDARERLEHGVEQRRVRSAMTEIGTGNLSIFDAPPDRVAAASRLINHLARSLNAAGDNRTMDQLRTDVALDLLTGTHLRGNPSRLGGVLMSVELTTLAGLDEHAGELNGFGPVIADMARQIVAQQHDVPWEYVVRDGDTGRIVATGTTQRRPTATQDRFVRARDPVCVFPGCRMPANDCDIDHTEPWAQTHRTDVTALAPCCRFDHNLRHKHGWTYRSLPNGQTEWTTQLGRKYTPPRDPP